jgi:DNA polymerase III alpha subunit
MRDIDQMQAQKVWEIIAGYTGYGFCKAHAATYALTAYRCAYAFAYYPAHFIAAQINNQGGYYGPSVYVEDARRLHITLLPPHISESGTWCEVPARQGNGSSAARSIRFGLQFVRGLSEKSIASILAERRSRGRFHSLVDFMSRVDLSPPEISALVKVGACDALGEAVAGESIPSIPTMPVIPSTAPMRGNLGEVIEAVYEPGVRLNRKQMVWLLPSLLSVRQCTAAQARQRATATGTGGVALQMVIGDIIQHSNFAGGGPGTGTGSPKILGKSMLRIDVPPLEEYTPTEKLRLEQETLGFALSHNEMEWLQVPGAISSSELQRYAEREVQVAGVAVAGRRHMGKDGKWMLFLSLQDREGLIEVVLFSDAYEKSGRVLANGGYGPYIVSGRV